MIELSHCARRGAMLHVCVGMCVGEATRGRAESMPTQAYASVEHGTRASTPRDPRRRGVPLCPGVSLRAYSCAFHHLRKWLSRTRIFLSLALTVH